MNPDRPIANIAPEMRCGVVMPISDSQGYVEGHWDSVRSIIFEAITNAGFAPALVSDSCETGLIHSRIVQNLHALPIVVCDVSSKNPNVMFELGLRLAFDKPVVLVKDKLTTFSFDTQVIEHLVYEPSTQYHNTKLFIDTLAQKIRDTAHEAKSNAAYSPFLRHFQKIEPKLIASQSVPAFDFIKAELTEVKQMLSRRSSDLEPTVIDSELLARVFKKYSSVAQSFKEIGQLPTRDVMHFHLRADSELTPFFNDGKNFLFYFSLAANLFDSLQRQC